jgi:hypothetical protein
MINKLYYFMPVLALLLFSCTTMQRASDVVSETTLVYEGAFADAFKHSYDVLAEQNWQLTYANESDGLIHVKTKPLVALLSGEYQMTIYIVEYERQKVLVDATSKANHLDLMGMNKYHIQKFYAALSYKFRD